MPSHLRNGRDLSGEQRRRYVEAGLPHPSGQRPVQRVEGQPPISQPSSDEGPGSESRSSSDPGQLPSHLFGVKIGNVDPSASSGGPSDRTAVGSNAVGGEKNLEPLGNYPPNGLNPSSSCRQSTTRDVHQHVPLPVVHVRRGQEDQRPGSHEGGPNPSYLESRAHQSRHEPRRIDGRVRELASRSGDGYHVPSKANHQRTDSPGDQDSCPSNGAVLSPGRRSDGLPGSYPGASNGSTSLIDLVSPPDQSELGVRTGSKSSAELRSTSSSTRNGRVKLRESSPQHGQFQNFVPNYAPVQNSAPAENLLPAQNSAMNYAPVQNSAPSYSMPSQQNLNQATYEHPRPPQQQQGSAATSHQAGPPFNGRQNHRRVRRDRFHYNRNELAAPQQHRPTLTQFNTSQVETWGIQEEKEESPTSRQHCQSLRGRDVFLRAERVLGRMQRTQSRMNTQNRNHPNQHRHQ
ncbi:hypothetical protein H4Q26_005251 [Puccinia striiformis f. sp. tritici PST-130]|nr:hypothetical protein H4Q26_005251 [Puccinia striiformis f. sp. tritici PST-130]